MQKFLEKLPFQLPIILILCAVIYILFREYKSLKYQKRFENFSLESSNDPEVSFLDMFIQRIWNWFESISKILNKNELLKMCGEKYDKFLILENSSAKSGMNYFLIKLICAFVALILTFIFMLKDFFYLSIFCSFIACLIGFFLPDMVLSVAYQKQKKKLKDNFREAIIILSHNFASGKNMIQAIESVTENLEGPLQKEFEKIQKDLNYGLSLEIVLERFYKRTKIKEIKYLSSVLTIINQTGGSVTKMFEQIEKNMQKEKQFALEYRYLLQSTIFTTNIFIIFPPLLFFLILGLNPEYFDPFFQTPYGFLVFLSLFLIYVFYVILITKLRKGGTHE